MRSLTVTKFGPPSVLQIRESADPVAGAGEVLVKVKRAGLNFADVSARVGLYPDAPPPPMVLGYEASGVVEALGGGVSGLAIGDRVLALTRFKGQASHVVAPAGQVKKLPDAMSFDEGAALPVNYLTAYHMLFHVGSLRPGDSILIHMAAGGVGLAAIQLCKLVKDVTIFGTASAGKHQLLRDAGVHHPIDYRTQDYVAEVRRLTDGKGVNMVLDALGGPDWNKGFTLLKPAGHLMAFGWANMVSGERRNIFRVVSQFLSMKRYAPMFLMDKNASVSGINVGHLWGEVELLSSHIDKLLELYNQGVVRPQISEVFPLSKGGEAHTFMQERKNVGKVLFDGEA